jgi:hypothetical protein
VRIPLSILDPNMNSFKTENEPRILVTAVHNIEKRDIEAQLLDTHSGPCVGYCEISEPVHRSMGVL